MKIRTTFALAAATLTLGVPVAAATPDGFQPQLQATAQPDAVDRYVANALRQAEQPDAIARYLRNNPSGETASVDRGEKDGSKWQTGAFVALGGVLLVIIAAFVASTMRSRRRLVLH